MAMCLDCGSIIMEGDPYCSHCGAHLRWTDDDIPEPPKRDNATIEDILDNMYLEPTKRRLLEGKIREYLNSKDCNSLEVRRNFNGYIFKFTRQNEYVRTEMEFEYYTDCDNPTRVFEECSVHHNHDNLIKSPKFQKLIGKVNSEFVGCSGGYVLTYSVCPDEFRMIDVIQIHVNFANGETYRLDLDKMELKEKNYEYLV